MPNSHCASTVVASATICNFSFFAEVSRPIIADCLRKWMEGARLNEQERSIVDRALANNRFELIREVFSQEGVDAR